MNPTRFQPVQSHERIQLMDALRGFALLGILLVNIWSLSRCEWLPREQQSPGWLRDGLLILIDTKFMTIFSLLFGAGFALQQQRADRRGVSFPWFYGWRMLLLFLIGCLHAYLFWFGDIIRHYALLGLFLLAVRRLSTRATFVLAWVFIGVLTPLNYLLNGVLAIRTAPEQVDGLPLTTYVYRAFTAGSYPEMLRANWIIDPFHNFLQDMPLTLVSMFGKMLLGVWLARIGFFQNPAAYRSRLRTWLLAGGTAGVAGSVAFWAVKEGRLPLDEPWMVGIVFLISVGLVLHSLFYVALFVRFYGGKAGAYGLRFLAPVGRMGLSNYVGQTLLAFGLFYGTGLVGRSNLTALLGWAIGIFAVQLLLSRWWLSRHAFGPVEGLWRRMSYARVKSPDRVQRPVEP